MFDVERLGPLSIVTMPRQLNVTHVRGLIGCVRGELADDAGAIVLDLRDTGAIDMTALACVVEMYKQSARRGVELRLSAPCESVRRLLAITRLDRVLRVDEGLGAESELGVAAE
jgi:anti-anti-sigma factor